MAGSGDGPATVGRPRCKAYLLVDAGGRLPGPILNRHRLPELAAAKPQVVSVLAAEGTIRKLFALSVGENSVPGTNSADEAKIEIALFFDQADIVG